MNKVKWDNLLNLYKNQYLHSRYAEHAQGMIDLIPQLEQHFDLHGAELETSLGNLVFQWKLLETKVLVWFEGGKYKIYLNHPDKGSFNTISVNRDAVIETLQGYLSDVAHPN